MQPSPTLAASAGRALLMASLPVLLALLCRAGAQIPPSVVDSVVHALLANPELVAACVLFAVEALLRVVPTRSDLSIANFVVRVLEALVPNAKYHYASETGTFEPGAAPLARAPLSDDEGLSLRQRTSLHRPAHETTP